jgi:hypothetical protein
VQIQTPLSFLLLNRLLLLKTFDSTELSAFLSPKFFWIHKEDAALVIWKPGSSLFFFLGAVPTIAGHPGAFFLTTIDDILFLLHWWEVLRRI